MAALLKLTALSRENQRRDLSFLVNDLEAGLDSLNRLVELGERLLQVRYVDQDGCVDLPIGIFDGSSFRLPIHQLSEEWEQLLAQPIASQSVAGWRQREVIEPLAAIRNKQIELLQSRLCKMLDLVESTQERMRDGPKKTHLLAHYQAIINRSKRSLAKITAKQYA